MKHNKNNGKWLFERMGIHTFIETCKLSKDLYGITRWTICPQTTKNIIECIFKEQDSEEKESIFNDVEEEVERHLSNFLNNS